MVNRHDFCVYAAGHVDEEDLCVEVRGAAVGVKRGIYTNGRSSRRGMYVIMRMHIGKFKQIL